MARRGTFAYSAGGSGRDLTATIKSLFDQQQAADDKAMFDGWQNGGLVGGKPVTDARILAYITSRQGQYAKGDPLYDQWGERLQQTQFSIGEQQATLRYRQSGSASVMADFYKSWLGKIPADSAFGRQVATSAAQWAKSASDAATSAARSRANAALTSQVNAITAATGSWNSLEAALTQAGQRAGYISGSQKAEDMTGEQLQNLFSSGAAVDPATGKAITQQSWQSAAMGYYNALGMASSVAHAEGKSSKDYDTAKANFLTNTIVRQNAVGFEAQYDAARSAFQQADSACQGDPVCSLHAAQTYATTLGHIRDGASAAGTGTKAVDPQFIGGLNNEILAVTGGTPSGPTAGQMQGLTTGNDAASLSAGFATTTAEAAALKDGTAYYGQKDPGGKLGVYPAPTGIGGGAMPPGITPSVIVGADGTAKTAWLAGQAVYSAVLVQRGGGAVDPTALSPAQIQAGLADGTLSWSGEQVVGYKFQAPGGGVTYGVRGANGALTYTTEDPFGQQYGKYVAAPLGTVTPSGASGTGFYIPPDAFAGSIPQGAGQSTALNVDPRLSETDVITAVSQNPGVFGSAGAQLLANVAAVQQTKGNDQLPSTAQDYLNSTNAANENAQALAALRASGPLAAALQASQGVGRGASLAGNVAGQYGAGFYGINGPSQQVTTPLGFLGGLLGQNFGSGTVPGQTGRPVPDLAPPPPEPNTIKLPSVGVPTAPPPIRQAGVTPQDVIAGPKAPTVAPPALPPVTPPPPLPAGIRQAGITDQDIIAGPRPGSPAPTSGTGSGTGTSGGRPGPGAV